MFLNITVFLIIAVFLISLLLTMVGLGGGLIFSPLFVLLGLPKTTAAAASLFLNLVAAVASFAEGRRGEDHEFLLESGKPFAPSSASFFLSWAPDWCIRSFSAERNQVVRPL